MTESQVALSILTKDAPRTAAEAAQSSGLPLERAMVVSNGSCGEADAELAKALPGITLVKVRPGRGLAFCLNLGLRRPAEAKWAKQPEWTILANDDILFEEDWLARLSAAVGERPELLQVNLAYPTNSYSCMAIRRALVRKIGWWDERFTGMFYEDDDWHLRLCEYAKYAPGTRVHETDKGGIFGRVKCARHDGRRHAVRAKERQRFGFTHNLAKAPNKAFFYEKWEVVQEHGWCGKGLPGRFARRLAEIEWHPMALLGGAMA